MTALAAALTGLLLALAAVAEADTDAADGNATAPRPGSVPNQGFGRHAGVSSLAVRAKESDDFSALASEKPAEPAPAKREAWKGFGREMSNGDDEVQMQGESASWNVLNHIGVEVQTTTPPALGQFGIELITSTEIGRVCCVRSRFVPDRKREPPSLPELSSWSENVAAFPVAVVVVVPAKACDITEP
ncbi:hypothetical protein GUJ93_ZPchr0014g47277 [Zizania palustris]|uniref:Uncharacterized protein n=1 Tax=Zizania palustris TaxID=103762 RepID=A0A8J5TCJ9_ZIZPA|nr:hypothetical protein GUJ93_ZPchr0014g47277 [Zizania palustris]